MSVRETYRIIECTKPSELAALSNANKELYKIFISAKMLNMDEGSVAKTKLWDMFPENTETGQKIRDWRNGLVSRPITPNPE